MKRWGTMAVATVAALGLLAPTVARAADLAAGYKFSVPVSTKGNAPDGSAYQADPLLQVGDLNIKDQFSYNAQTDAGGEGEWAWDGTKSIQLNGAGAKLPNGWGIKPGNANQWTPHGLNDAGHLAIVIDTDADTSPHAIVVFDINTKQFTIVSTQETVPPGGGKFGAGGVIVEGRMVADINNKDQVVWSQAVSGADGNDEDGVFLYDPATKALTAVARNGMKLPTGKTINNAVYPDINDKGQVVFMANTTDSDDVGIYQWENSSFTTIAAPGTKVGNLTIAQAKFARNSSDYVVFTGETTSSGVATPVTEDTGIFLYHAGQITKVVAPGDAMPGGGTWLGPEHRRRSVGVNDSGLVAFKGEDGTDSGGVWLYKDGQLSNLIHTGANPGGIGNIDGINRDQNFTGYHMAINNNGDVLVSAKIAGVDGFILATAPKP